MFRNTLSALSIALLSIGTAPTLFAQVDINKMIQGSAQIEDDNDPFIPNAFVGSFRMEMHLYKGDEEQKSSPMDMHYWSTPEMTLVKTTGPGITQDTKMLTDLKSKWQYMLMTDTKGKMTAMKSHKKKIVVDDEASRNVPEIVVMEETKMIDGHLCNKVISKSEKGVWTGWLAKDVELPFAEMFRQMQQGKSDQSGVLTNIYGIPMEYEWVDADGKDRIVCYIRDLKIGAVDEKLFSLEGYEVMEMPGYGK